MDPQTPRTSYSYPQLPLWPPSAFQPVPPTLSRSLPFTPSYAPASTTWPAVPPQTPAHQTTLLPPVTLPPPPPALFATFSPTAVKAVRSARDDGNSLARLLQEVTTIWRVADMDEGAAANSGTDTELALALTDFAKTLRRGLWDFLQLLLPPNPSGALEQVVLRLVRDGEGAMGFVERLVEHRGNWASKDRRRATSATPSRTTPSTPSFSRPPLGLSSSFPAFPLPSPPLVPPSSPSTRRQPLPPLPGSAREAYQRRAREDVMKEVEEEGERLMGKDSRLRVKKESLSWTFYEGFSFGELALWAEEQAPVSWGMLVKLAQGRVAKATLRETLAFTLSILVHHRSRACNVVQELLGVLLVSSGASETVHNIFSRLGLASHVRTVGRHLEHVGRKTASMLQDLVRQGMKYSFVYDNVNRMTRRDPRNQRFGREDQIENGVAATWIQLEGVEDDALDPEPYHHARAGDARRALSVAEVERSMNPLHRSIGVRQVALLSLLIRRVEALAPLTQELEELEKKQEIMPQETRRSKMVPIATSSQNEALVSETPAIIDHLFGWIGSQVAELKELVFVFGDQLTIRNLRLAQLYTALPSLPGLRSRLRNLVSVASLWHWAYNELEAIVRTFYSSASTHGSLAGDIELLRRKGVAPNQIKFRSTHQAVLLICEARVLHLWVTHLRQHPSTRSHPLLSPAATTLPPLDFLSLFFRTINHSFDNLIGMAEDIDDEYLSDDALNDFLVGDDQVQPIEPPDYVLYSTGLFLRDAVRYREWCMGMRSGDAARVWEVVKNVTISLAGSGHFNYVYEGLELFCSFTYEWSDALKTTLFRNWIVNPSGRRHGWIATDLVQEYFIRALKSSARSSSWSSHYIQQVISPNLSLFASVKRAFQIGLGLSPSSTKHGVRTSDAHLLTLLSHYDKLALHTRAFRISSPPAVDRYKAGLLHLEKEGISRFLSRSHVPTVRFPEEKEDEPSEEEIAAAILGDLERSDAVEAEEDEEDEGDEEGDVE